MPRRNRKTLYVEQPLETDDSTPKTLDERVEVKNNIFSMLKKKLETDYPKVRL